MAKSPGLRVVSLFHIMARAPKAPGHCATHPLARGQAILAWLTHLLVQVPGTVSSLTLLLSAHERGQMEEVSGGAARPWPSSRRSALNHRHIASSLAKVMPYAGPRW